MQELTGMLGIATVKPGTQPRKFVALTDPNRSQTRDYSHVRRTVQGDAGCRGAAACWVLLRAGCWVLGCWWVLGCYPGQARICETKTSGEDLMVRAEPKARSSSRSPSMPSGSSET